MAYYAVLKLLICYRYYLKVSIILGLHKVRAVRDPKAKTCESHISTAASHAYFAETFLLDQLYLYLQYVILYIIFKLIIVIYENNTVCLTE
jgi:hypothetical protein